MVELKILSGKQAGTSIVTRRFPVRVGRLPGNALQLDDAGVWDNHLRIDFRPGTGYTMGSESGALVSVNGAPVESARLRNGDQITAGAVLLQFWLAEAPQRRLSFRETFTWVLIGAICLLQVALVYILVRW